MPTNLGPEADANTIRPPGNLEVAECILHLADGPKGQRADSGGFKILAPIFLMSHIKKWGLHPFPMNPVRLVTVSINRTE